MLHPWLAHSFAVVHKRPPLPNHQLTALLTQVMIQPLEVDLELASSGGSVWLKADRRPDLYPHPQEVHFRELELLVNRSNGDHSSVGPLEFYFVLPRVAVKVEVRLCFDGKRFVRDSLAHPLERHKVFALAAKRGQSFVLRKYFGVLSPLYLQRPSR